MLEQGPDFWRWFGTTQFSYHCVHPIHAKMFSIQMLQHFSQNLIVPRVCTLVPFIINRTSTLCISRVYALQILSLLAHIKTQDVNIGDYFEDVTSYHYV